jgi:alpha-mannosidase
VGEDGERKVLVEAQQVPSLGYRAYPVLTRETGRIATENEISVSPTCLENRYYRIELNERGQITALLDKRHKRQVLQPGAAGNVLQAFEDKPMDFDAWDIDIYYQEKMRPVDQLVEATVEENRPLRGVLHLVWRFLDSQIVQRLTIYRSSPRIDFKTEANWQEKQILLKAAFPVAVRATRATYEIQLGNVERPTHLQPAAPRRGWRESAVMPEAYALNYPPEADLARQNGSGALRKRFSFARLDSDHVILETVKKAEDEDAWIVRLYEAKQYRNPAIHLDFGRPIRKAAACNLMEEEERPADFEGHRLIFSINPYQIRTFKVWF